MTDFLFNLHQLSNEELKSFGGQYVSEILFPSIAEVEKYYNEIRDDKDFAHLFYSTLSTFAGRPTPLYKSNFFSKLKNCPVYFKREDLNHTGSHKINNAVGQVLLAQRMGKKKIVAETGAGQHGVATATACALLGMECIVYQGEIDIQKQKQNAIKMRALGARLEPVTSGAKTLKDAINEAMRHWIGNLETTHYVLGSACGPYPFTGMVRDFQSVIGWESKSQILKEEGRLPTRVISCVGGGSNAMGIFSHFVEHEDVKLVCVEAGGGESGNAKTLSDGTMGIFQGAKSLFLQDKGNMKNTHSISSGLDYPGVSPELALLKSQNRLTLESANDDEVIDAFKFLVQNEGIFPALETSHAISYLMKTPTNKDDILIVNLSGRGDKDIDALIDGGLL